ncbi:hypothetical protein [Winogradskyella forsetii]|uniref:hypothetical protein n=1 Tax=Winogradskyella forsetii TaxID=2686077 RepID=UPI0015B9C8F2|nr:hypothetical protein [Winogradskyella forsetii]
MFSYGQDIIFEKNDNRAARALEHNLNKNKDSLIFKSEKIITQVDIFNDHYMSSVEVNNNESKIDIANLPSGRFIVQARLGRKRIIMYLVKEQSLVQNLDITDINMNTGSEIASAEDGNKNIVKSSKKVKAKSTKKSERLPESYWVVYEKNTHSGSSKTMSIANEDEVARMISRNQLELSTEIAKDNTLLVYEIYNTGKFMRKQLRKPGYFKSSKSRFFNVVPYYKSQNLNTVIQ